MDVSTLISLIKKDEIVSQYFRGCVAINQFIDEAYLYKDSNAPNFWIVYIPPPPGEKLGHFFTFACKNIVLAKPGETIVPSSGTWYCDSFALKPAYYSSRLEEAFVNLSTYGSFQSVPFQLQNAESNICALYSMFFADKFCSKPTSQLNLDNFVRQNFDPANTVENDNRVLSYYQHKLRVPKRKLSCFGANFCTSLNKFLDTPRDLTVE
jgi:hypothetical protein